MKNHGNLYWEISFAFAYNPADMQFCEHTRIKVSSYDYNDVFRRAKALYDALTAAGGILLNFVQYLREDDSAENEGRHFGIYATWYLRGNAGAFFSSSPDHAIRTLMRV